jgi:hypothetical protein
MAILVVSFVAATLKTVAVQDQDQSKAIKAEEFIKGRPAKGVSRRAPATAKYKRDAGSTGAVSEATPPAGMAFAQLGVTFWRFRRSTVADQTKELVEDEEGDSGEWTLERIEEGTPLSPGQKVRLSIESLSRDGYLYAIDREEYADGTFGDPVLIFPTKKTEGANRVRAGHLIYLPSASGKFRIKPTASAKTHIGEVVTIIVAPKPLISEEQLGPKSIKLSRQQVESWEQQWGGTVSKFEMDGGAGQAMTEREQTAASDHSQVLTQEDPAPQTVYRLAVKPENPIVVTLHLKFARSTN